jgi:hypothetical protein
LLIPNANSQKHQQVLAIGGVAQSFGYTKCQFINTLPAAAAATLLDAVWSLA